MLIPCRGQKVRKPGVPVAPKSNGYKVAAESSASLPVSSQLQPSRTVTMIRIQDYLPTAKEEAANDEVLRPLREQAREDKRRQEIRYAATGEVPVCSPLFTPC